MPGWINRSVSVDSTGASTTGTYTFTAATTGRLLVAVCFGPVTWTTPSGWSLTASAVGGSGLYVFTKTAAGGETSFTSTHNGTGASDYPNQAVIYEFPAGSSIVGTPGTVTLQSVTSPPFTTPSATGLTGTYTAFSAISETTAPPNTNVPVYSWASPALTGDSPGKIGGAGALSSAGIGYIDGRTGTSFSSSCTDTNNLASTAELITFAVFVAPPSGFIPPVAQTVPINRRRP